MFPSVTAAALAAMAMQEELSAQPNRGDDRLAMRVVITLGDVLHEEGALVGDAVVLTARIESITLHPDQNTASMTTVEKILETLFELIHRTVREFSGAIRFGTGDEYCLTFADPASPWPLRSASARAGAISWTKRSFLVPCVAVHRGTLYAFRSYLSGPGIEIASQVEAASHAVLRPDEGAVFVTGEVRSQLTGTGWEKRLTVAAYRLAKPISQR